MCDQDDVINWPEPGRIKKARWSSMQIIGEVNVISKIAGQKQGRSRKGRDHAIAMGILPLFANENVARAEKDSAQTVQDSIDWWQIQRSHGPLSLSSFLTAARRRFSKSASVLSNAPRRRACLSTSTKIVLWMKRSSAEVRSWDGFSSAINFRPPTANRAISSLGPVTNDHLEKFALNREAHCLRTSDVS